MEHVVTLYITRWRYYAHCPSVILLPKSFHRKESYPDYTRRYQHARNITTYVQLCSTIVEWWSVLGTAGICGMCHRLSQRESTRDERKPHLEAVSESTCERDTALDKLSNAG